MATDILLTFDFDAEAPRLGAGVDNASRDLTERSLGAYGGRRGIARIVDLLEELEIKCTFFVPGWTVEAYSGRVRELHGLGHEIGHHGYQHVPPVQLSAREQREDLLRGLTAIERCTGQRPLGYRSPSWQLTPVVLALLEEFQFVYDSSCMGDDRPYLENFGDVRILELPVHWTLDDFPHFGWTLDYAGPLRDPEATMVSWRREVEVAIREQRPLVLTCHPEFVGRAGPMDALAGFVRELHRDRRVRFARCIDLARTAWPLLRPGEQVPTG